MLWLITIALGAIFMFGTAQEWRRLIYEHGLTISTNLFGTTYYSLVGLHAFHVTLGLVMLTTVFVLSVAAGARTQSSANRRAVALLALRRRGVDCRLHRRVHHRALSRRHGDRRIDRDRSARADGVAARPGDGRHADVRGAAHERVGDRARRRPVPRRMRGLVPRGRSRRSRRRSAARRR